jgi:hypothetical protein
MEYSNVIIHAGGSVQNMCYTNSLESIYKNVINLANVINNKIILCELDCCKLKDYYVLAHDGHENAYGLETPFYNSCLSDLLNKKIYNNLTPMYFYNLYNFIKETNINVSFIIDSKHDLNDDFINHILENMKEHSNKIILQVYKKEDIFFVEKYKLNCLYALWKCNHAAFNDNIKENLEYIINNKIQCIGISLFYKYYVSPQDVSKSNLKNLQRYNYKIFLHGENNIDNCLNAIREGYGIFSHHPEKILKTDYVIK